MAREWIHETSARWDEAKTATFGELSPELFGIPAPALHADLGGEWWRVQDGEEVVGYGRLDDVWGDAEILVVVGASARGTGVGDYILGQLDREASERHLNYVYNRVDPEHPARDRVARWLEAHGFGRTAEGDYRKRVGTGSIR